MTLRFRAAQLKILFDNNESSSSPEYATLPHLRCWSKKQTSTTTKEQLLAFPRTQSLSKSSAKLHFFSRLTACLITFCCQTKNAIGQLFDTSFTWIWSSSLSLFMARAPWTKWPLPTQWLSWRRTKWETWAQDVELLPPPHTHTHLNREDASARSN